MPGLLDILQSLLAQPQQAQMPAAAGIAPSRFDGPGALSDPGIQAALAGQSRTLAPSAPVQPQQAQTAPSPAPMPQSAPASPQGGNGGGLGDFLGGLIAPQRAGRNRTVSWLQQQGLDEGTATLLAGNKGALQKYLIDRSMGNASEFDQRAQAAQRFGLSGEEAQQFVLTGKLDGDKDLINAGKGRLYDPNTGQWLTAPDMGTDAPTVQSFYDENGMEYKAQWNPQKREWEPVGGSKVPSDGVTVTSPDGTVMQLGGSGQKLTEGQSKDVAYYTQGADANARLSELEGQLTDFSQQKAELLPLGIGNYLRTPEFRQAKQAGERFLTSVLRKETGAAVTAEEWNRYGPMFLPVPGDDPTTLQQKRRAREVALLAIRSGLGTAEAIAAANRITLGLPDDRNLTPMPGRPMNEADSRNQRSGGGLGAPSIGTVEDGYRFKGGDPGNPNSWERVQ